MCLTSPPRQAKRPSLQPRGIAAAARQPGALGGGEEAGAISMAPLQNLVRQAAPAVKASAWDFVKGVGQRAPLKPARKPSPRGTDD